MRELPRLVVQSTAACGVIFVALHNDPGVVDRGFGRLYYKVAIRRCAAEDRLLSSRRLLDLRTPLRRPWISCFYGSERQLKSKEDRPALCQTSCELRHAYIVGALRLRRSLERYSCSAATAWQLVASRLETCPNNYARLMVCL